MLSRLRRGRWTKLVLLSLLPLILYCVAARQVSWRPKTIHGPRSNIIQIAFSPDGRTMAVAAQSTAMTPLASRRPGRRFDDAIDIWDVASLSFLRRIELPQQYLSSIAFSPDNRSINGVCSQRKPRDKFTIFDDITFQSTLKEWEVNSGKLLHAFRVCGDASHLSFWPNADTLTIYDHCVDESRSSSFFQREIRQHDARTGKMNSEPLYNDEADDSSQNSNAVAYSPDGKIIAQNIGHGGGFTIDLWDTRTRKIYRRLATNNWKLDELSFSADSRTLAGCGIDMKSNPVGGVQVWDVQTGKILSRFFGGSSNSLKVGRGLLLWPSHPMGDFWLTPILSTIFCCAMHKLASCSAL